MKVWVIKFTNKHESYHATRSTRELAIAFIAMNAESLLLSDPEHYLAEEYPDVVKGISSGDGEIVLEEWSAFSGETEYYELIETLLGEGFTSAS